MGDKIKVLFLSANPSSTVQLRIDEELRAIRIALRNNGHEQLFDIIVEPALRPTELSTAIVRESPDIIHYSGHGDDQELYLAADDHSAAPLSSEEIRHIFKVFADSKTSCVLLNACFSATVAEAIYATIPCVVGMTTAIADTAARDFAAGFYTMLAAGGSLRQAFEHAKIQIGKEHDHIPKLYAKEWLAESLYFVGHKARRLTLEERAPEFNPESPYRGLEHFEKGHCDLFFGRDVLIAELVHTVLQNNFVLITGASGSGKSSVVRAGLIPQLEERLPSNRFRELVLTPDRSPFSSLRSVLKETPRARHEILDLLDERTSRSLVAAFNALRPREQCWLLFVDQFEEVFTRCANDVERSAFIDGLMALAQTQQAELRIVLAMRADFLDRLGSFPALWGVLKGSHHLVTDMQPDQLRLAIEQPALRQGVVFEDGLVEMIIADFSGQPGALPLLQYTLDLLWKYDLPEQDKTLNKVSYLGIGGVSGALKQQADRLYDYRDSVQKIQRSDEQKASIRRVFLRLVDFAGPTADSRAIRKRALRSEFERPGEAELVSALIDEKLLVANSGGELEIAHDALLRGWPKLQEWILQGREVIYVHNRLKSDLDKWLKKRAEGGSGVEEELWTGSRLGQAQEMRERGDFISVFGGLSADAEQFLNDSLGLRAQREEKERENERRIARIEAEKNAEVAKKELEKQRQRNQLLRIGAGLAVASMLIQTGVAIYALIKRSDAEKQELKLNIEHGRQRLLNERPAEAMVWLQRAYEQQSQSWLPRAWRPNGNALLPLLLRHAARPLDATQTTLTGHTAPVRSGRYNRDGTRMVTAGDDGLILVWDAKSGKQLRKISGHKKEVRSVEFSPDGRRILSASEDGTVAIWGDDDDKPLHILKGHKETVHSAHFDHNGQRVVTASEDKSVKIFDADNGAYLMSLPNVIFAVRSAEWSPDGRYIVIAGEEHEVRVFVAATGKEWVVLPGHQAAVERATFSPDSRRILTAGRDGRAFLWNAAKPGLPPIEFKPLDAGSIRSATFSPDGQRIVIAGTGPEISVWDGYGTPLSILRGHSGTVEQASFSPDGHRVVTAGEDSTVRVWDAQDGRLLAILQAHAAEVQSAVFSPDGRRILSTSLDSTSRILVPRDGNLLLTWKAHNTSINTVAFDSKGEQVVTASSDNSAQLWDAETGKRLGKPLKGHQQPVVDAGFGLQDSTVITSGEDGHTILHDLKNPVQTRALSEPSSAIRRARFSPNGLYIVRAMEDDNSAYVFDRNAKEPRLKLVGHDGAIRSLGISPDNSQIVTAGEDRTARIWDAKTGEHIRTFSGHAKTIVSVSFSPDGHYVITASEDRTARIWSTSTNKVVVLAGHEKGLRSARFSPVSPLVATAGEDGTVRLWDAAEGKQLFMLGSHTGSILAINFNPAGNRLITASEDGIVRLWEIAEEKRSAEEIKNLMRCRLPLLLEKEALVPAPLDAAACSLLRASPTL